METQIQLPEEIIEKIIYHKKEKSAKIIQWHFREQNKLETEFFELLNTNTAKYDNIYACLKLFKRLHLNEIHINNYCFECITDKMHDFCISHSPTNAYFNKAVKLEKLYEDAFEMEYQLF